MNKNFWQEVCEILKEFFSWIHTVGFKTIGVAFRDSRYERVDKVILEMLFGIFFIVLIVAIYVFVIKGIYKLFSHIIIIIRTKEIKYYNVTGKVKRKKRKYNYKTIYLGKILIASYYEVDYNIYVESNEAKKVFNSEKMFYQYNKGDFVSIIVVERLGKNGNVIKRTLKLPE